ncbi:MAG: hypothetical protein ACYS0D_04165 [Planctomycetota bacterium]|jgi:hypothetical protein
MLKRIVSIAALFAIGAGVTAYAAVVAQSDRPDCPGKIICPLTGDLVCKDRCPLSAETNVSSAEPSTLPPCCRMPN